MNTLDNRTFVIGDIHGELDKLNSLLKNIKPQKNDTLIFLGDYVDRGPDSCGVIERLIELQSTCSCRFIMGNHDKIWYEDLINNRPKKDLQFLEWGADQTYESYKTHQIDPKSHLEFFENLYDYYTIKDENSYRIFTHGGFHRSLSIKEQPKDIWYWDRELLMTAFAYKDLSPTIKEKYLFTKDNFTHIYLGHTPTQGWDQKSPLFVDRVILMDTGVGKYSNSDLYALEIYSEKLIKSN